MSRTILLTRIPTFLHIAKDVSSHTKYWRHCAAAIHLHTCCSSASRTSQVKTRWKYPASSDLRHSCIEYRVRIYSTNPSHQRVTCASPKVVIEGEVVENAREGGTLWRRAAEAARPYVQLARMDRPIGTWLLFWPCSWSICLAAVQGGVAPADTLRHLALFLAGSVVMRGAGCTINDLWDRDIDKQVARTRDRPLASGALSPRCAVYFLAAQLSAGLAVLLQLNWYSVVLGASSLALVVAYPLAKRVTNYPQLFLGATFNWGALLGWSAQLGSVEPRVCLPLYGAALCWSVVYDTIYAHQDKEDDARIGMKSTALTFGAHTKPALGACAAGVLGGACAAGSALALDAPYWLAVSAVGAHMAWQIYTLDVNNPSDCADKFKSNSLVGLILLLGIVGGGWRQYCEKLRAAKQRGAIPNAVHST